MYSIPTRHLRRIASLCVLSSVAMTCLMGGGAATAQAASCNQSWSNFSAESPVSSEIRFGITMNSNCSGYAVVKTRVRVCNENAAGDLSGCVDSGRVRGNTVRRTSFYACATGYWRMHAEAWAYNGAGAVIARWDGANAKHSGWYYTS